MCQIGTTEYYSSIKEGKSVIYNNMDQHGWHHSK
jgi:hypothetical protein